MDSRSAPDALTLDPSVKRKTQDSTATPLGRPLVSINSPMLKDVSISLKASLGHANLSLEDLLALRAGSVVKLDLQMNDLIDLQLNGSLVARGEIVAVGDHFGVRIVQIAEVV